jgi:hypothetical protein
MDTVARSPAAPGRVGTTQSFSTPRPPSLRPTCHPSFTGPLRLATTSPEDAVRRATLTCESGFFDALDVRRLGLGMLMLTVIVALLVRPYWALLGLPLVPNQRVTPPSPDRCWRRTPAWQPSRPPPACRRLVQRRRALGLDSNDLCPSADLRRAAGDQAGAVQAQAYMNYGSSGNRVGDFGGS